MISKQGECDSSSISLSLLYFLHVHIFRSEQLASKSRDIFTVLWLPGTTDTVE